MIQWLGGATTRAARRREWPCVSFSHRAYQLGRTHGKAPGITINLDVRRAHGHKGTMDELMPRFLYTSARSEVLGDEPKALSIFGKGAWCAFSHCGASNANPITVAAQEPRGTVPCAAGLSCSSAPWKAIATTAGPRRCMRCVKDSQRLPEPIPIIEIVSGYIRYISEIHSR